jgi:hypothetical protein
VRSGYTSAAGLIQWWGAGCASDLSPRAGARGRRARRGDGPVADHRRRRAARPQPRRVERLGAAPARRRAEPRGVCSGDGDPEEPLDPALGPAALGFVPAEDGAGRAAATVARPLPGPPLRCAAPGLGRGLARAVHDAGPLHGLGPRRVLRHRRRLRPAAPRRRPALGARRRRARPARPARRGDRRLGLGCSAERGRGGPGPLPLGSRRRWPRRRGAQRALRPELGAHRRHDPHAQPLPRARRRLHLGRGPRRLRPARPRRHPRALGRLRGRFVFCRGPARPDVGPAASGPRPAHRRLRPGGALASGPRSSPASPWCSP